MRTNLLRRVLGFLTALPLTAATACCDPADSAHLQASLEALAEREVADNDFLGIGISVRLADGRVFSADAGHSDPEGRAAYDATATEQVIGSVTKLYTATMIMQLVESGDLALDDTIDRWFTFPGAERMTVRMLLQHTTGLAEYLSGMSIAELGHPWTPEQLLERSLSGERYGAPPLAQAVYTNTPFLLLGRIVEAETGKSWADNIAERIVRPLGLEHTYYAGEDAKASGLAGGWMMFQGEWIDTMDHLDPSVGWGGGAVVSTNEELMRFIAAFFDGALFEDPATLEAMLRFDTVMDPAHLGEEPPSNVGLAVIRMEIDGLRLDGHLGHQHGFNAGAVRDPDTGALIVVTSNDDRAFSGYTILKVAKRLRAL